MAPKHHIILMQYGMDLVMTIISLTSSVLAVIVSKVIYFIPVLISGIYWFARMKRDVQTYHQGSFRQYVKFLFGRIKKPKTPNDSNN